MFFYILDVWVKTSSIQGYVCECECFESNVSTSFESEVIACSMMYDSTSEIKENTDKLY